jgi:hypothetical protein
LIGCMADWSSGAPPSAGGSNASVALMSSSTCQALPLMGLHVLNAVEASNVATQTATFFGTGFATSPQSQALQLKIEM